MYEQLVKRMREVVSTALEHGTIPAGLTISLLKQAANAIEILEENVYFYKANSDHKTINWRKGQDGKEEKTNINNNITESDIEEFYGEAVGFRKISEKEADKKLQKIIDNLREIKVKEKKGN